MNGKLGVFTIIAAVSLFGISTIAGSAMAAPKESKIQEFSDGTVVLASSSTSDKAHDKVMICHVTGSGKEVTITIPMTSYPAHMSHGDKPYPCD